MRVSLLTVALGLVLSGHAHAAPAPDTPLVQAVAQDGSTDKARTLDAIEVRGTLAEGLEQSAEIGVLGARSLLDTPFSLHVLDGSLIELQQARTYGDYLKNDASVSIGNVPVGFVLLRGFLVGVDGFLYDGIPGAMGISDGRNQIEGVERVEVFKGPSAFLSGLGSGGSVGGTINFVPKRAPRVGEAPIRQVSLGAASHSQYSVMADLGGRAGTDKRLGYRLNLGWRDGEQAVERADWRHGALVFAGDWRVNDRLDIEVNYENAYNRFPSLQPFFIVQPGVAVPKPPRLNRSIAQPWDDFSVRSTNAYARANWRLSDDWTLTTQLLHSESRRPLVKEARFGIITNDAGDAVLFSSADEYAQRGSTAQLLLRGTLTTGTVQHTLTFGVGGYRSDGRGGSATLGAGVIPINIYAPVDSPEPDDVEVAVSRSFDTRNRSVVASDIVDFNAHWSALLGARHARIASRNFDPATGATTADNALSRTSPTAALMFKPRSDMTVYGSYAEGIEQGGTAPQGSANQDQVLAPVVTRQTELGVKWQPGRLGLTGAIFDLRRPLEAVNPQTLVFEQSGRQRHRGIEIGATGALTETLNMVAGAMWLDTSTDDTGDASTDGKRVLGVCERMGHAFLDWRVPGIHGLSLNVGAYAQGPQSVDGANTQRIPGAIRFDVGARYAMTRGDTQATLLLGVENATDRQYWAGAQSGLLTLAEPRTYKATLTLDF